MPRAASGADFIVVYGFMPPKVTLFGDGCRPKFDFGNMSVNEALWSPHARFLALAGFGALNGDIEFWDTNKMKKIGAANSRWLLPVAAVCGGCCLWWLLWWLLLLSMVAVCAAGCGAGLLTHCAVDMLSKPDGRQTLGTLPQLSLHLADAQTSTSRSQPAQLAGWLPACLHDWLVTVLCCYRIQWDVVFRCFRITECWNTRRSVKNSIK